MCASKAPCQSFGQLAIMIVGRGEPWPGSKFVKKFFADLFRVADRRAANGSAHGRRRPRVEPGAGAIATDRDGRANPGKRNRAATAGAARQRRAVGSAPSVRRVSSDITAW